MKLYKLVSKDWTTRNNMKWEIGKTNYAIGHGIKLSSDDVLHAYIDPVLAIMLNPIHANFSNPILLEVEASEIVASDVLKVGVKSMTPVKRLDAPLITTEQYIAFGIYCAMNICDDPKWNTWANAWLNGADRSIAAAAAAAAAARYAINYPAVDAADAARYAINYPAAARYDAADAARYATADAAIRAPDEPVDITLISCAYAAINNLYRMETLLNSSGERNETL